MSTEVIRIHASALVKPAWRSVLPRTCPHGRIDRTLLPQRDQPTLAVWCVDCGHSWTQICELGGEGRAG